MQYNDGTLKLEGLRVCFPKLTIDAEFSVCRGERLILSGPSGSGKTTIFRFLAGFSVEGCESGRVLLGSQDLTHRAPEQRGFGILFQEAVVFPALSVLENAAFGLKVRGVGQDERRQLVMPWLERCGLLQHADADATTLSGGEKQRLALVRALCWKPHAVLLDEPFSALDPALRSEMGRWLLELHAAQPVPLVLVTHDSEEAGRLGTSTLMMKDHGEVHRWRSPGSAKSAD
jgi:ABC-type Fe3+/spermidine/putrescine transport system ATPase subunit